jgi:hypothetical protein
MPRWLPAILTRIRQLALKRRVRFTLKALSELASMEDGLDVEDMIEIVLNLRRSDSAGRLVSKHTGEWLYVFKPRVGETVIYLKLVVRGDCTLLSCHEDEEDEIDEDEAK